MKPSDIFIGVIDFFSVILPGALLTYFLAGRFYGDVFVGGNIFLEPATETSKWIVFLLITYIVGNMVFMVASLLDFTYDRVLRKRLFQSKYDLKFRTACQIREKFIKTDTLLHELVAKEKISDSDYVEILDNPKREIFNTFKWIQHYLLFNKPEALADIRRTEADSKFFRSLVVAFLIIAVLMLVQIKILLGVIFIVLAVLSYYRYGDLRYKATEKAYEMIITYFYQKTEEPLKKADIGSEPNGESRKNEESKKTEENNLQSSAVLRNDLSADFLSRNHELISFLAKGMKKEMKRITIIQDENKKKIFISDKNESWFCMQGHGILHTGTDDEAVNTILIPQAIVPLTKGCSFSVSNSGNEPIEILSLEN